VDSTNHSGWLWITSITGLIFVVCSGLYRVIQCRKIWAFTSFDDHLAVSGFVSLAIWPSILSFYRTDMEL